MGSAALNLFIFGRSGSFWGSYEESGEWKFFVTNRATNFFLLCLTFYFTHGKKKEGTHIKRWPRRSWSLSSVPPLLGVPLFGRSVGRSVECPVNKIKTRAKENGWILSEIPTLRKTWTWKKKRRKKGCTRKKGGCCFAEPRHFGVESAALACRGRPPVGLWTNGFEGGMNACPFQTFLKALIWVREKNLLWLRVIWFDLIVLRPHKNRGLECAWKVHQRGC